MHIVRSQSALEQLATQVRHAAHSIAGFIDLANEEPLTPRQNSCLRQCRGSLQRLLEAVDNECGIPPDLYWAVEPALWSPEAMLDWLDRETAARTGWVAFDICANGVPASLELQRGAAEDVVERMLDECATLPLGSRVSVDVGWNEGMLGFDFGLPGGDPDSVSAKIEARAAAAGGRLDIVCRLDRSMIVRLRLPAQCLGEVSAAALAAPGESVGGPMSLLVAEDSDDSYALLEAFLEGEVHTLIRACDGLEALERFKERKFDLVLMDVQMPGIDGHTATRLIREWETSSRRERTPIVLVSAENRAKLMREGAASGCSGFLPKPLARADLLRALDYYRRVQRA